MRHELILHTGPLGPAKRDETVKPDPAETWKPHDSNPDLEVNGRGQLRTKALAPPQPVTWPFPLSGGVLDPVAVDAVVAATVATRLAQYRDRPFPNLDRMKAKVNEKGQLRTKPDPDPDPPGVVRPVWTASFTPRVKL